MNESKKTFTKKDDALLTISCIVSILLVGFFMYIGWMIVDPSQCTETKYTNGCVIVGWSIRLFIISMPIIVTIGVWRIFRQDKNESTSTYTPQREPYKPLTEEEKKKQSQNDSS